jgi:hypothetical protein
VGHLVSHQLHIIPSSWERHRYRLLASHSGHRLMTNLPVMQPVTTQALQNGGGS